MNKEILMQVIYPKVLEEVEGNIFYGEFSGYNVEIKLVPTEYRIYLTVYGKMGEREVGVDKLVEYIKSIYMNIPCEYNENLVKVTISTMAGADQFKDILDIIIEYFEQHKYQVVEIPGRIEEKKLKEEVVNTAEPIKAVSESGKYSLNIENTNSIQDDPEVKKQADEAIELASSLINTIELEKYQLQEALKQYDETSSKTASSKTGGSTILMCILASIIGTIPGVILYAIIGQAGFINKAAGIVILAGAVGGYLFVDKRITAKTLIICGCTTLMATCVATYFIYVGIAMNLTDEGIIFNCMAALLAVEHDLGIYLFAVAKGLVLELVGAVGIYIMYIRARNR